MPGKVRIIGVPMTSRLRKGLLIGGLLAGSLGFMGYAGFATAQINANSPSLSQSVALTDCLDIANYVCVDYTATLTDVAQATRIINRIKNNGNKVLISKTTINTSPYHEILDMNKGKYEFKLKSPDATTNKTSITVPNYAPTADFSSLETRIVRNTSKTYDLCSPIRLITDRNREDNPVPIVKAVRLTTNIQTNLSGCNLTVTSTGELGPYQVKVKFGVKRVGQPYPSAILAGEIIPQEQIAFWRIPANENNEDIYLADLINDKFENIQRLTTNPAQDLEPSWSPDGAKLAFTSNREDVNGDTIKDIAVYTMNIDSSNQVRLTPNIQHAQQPRWSPDGNKIAFRFVDSNRAGIALINPDGSGFTKLVDEPFSAVIPGGPTWSPDGSQIAFYAHTNGNWEIYKINVDGTGRERLTNNLSVDQQPVWSSNGEIAFMSDREGSLDIYVMNSDGTNVRRLTTIGSDFDPNWSPDATKIDFTRDFQIWLMNSDGSGLVQLTFPETDGQNRYPAWRPRP